MDSKIKEYADQLYSRDALRLSRSCAEQVRAIRARWGAEEKRRGFNGFEYSTIVRVLADFVGRELAARLGSYEEAFRQKRSEPSRQDFDEILSEVVAVKERTLKARRRQLLRQHSEQHDRYFEPNESLEPEFARAYEPVLHEWKVWRARTNLGISPVAADQSTTFNIGNYVNGNVGNSQLQAGTSGNTQSGVTQSEGRWLGSWWGKITIGVVTGLIVAIVIWLVSMFSSSIHPPPSGLQGETKTTEPQRQLGPATPQFQQGETQAGLKQMPPTNLAKQQSPRNPSETEGISREDDLLPTARKGKTTKAAPPTSTVPGSITVTSNHQQGGITAGIVNINPTARPLLLSGEQQEAVRESVTEFTGTTADIIINRPTEETYKFGVDLQLALQSAGIHANLSRVMGMYAPPPNCIDHPGLWFIVGPERMKEAESLATAMAKSGVVEGKISACAAERLDDFTVVVSRPGA